MMRCAICSHEYTAFDFVTLRNLCEHVYLDSLAQKHDASSSDSNSQLQKLKHLQPI